MAIPVPNLKFNPREQGSEHQERIVPTYNSIGPRQLYSMMEDYYIQGGFKICDTISGSTTFPDVTSNYSIKL